MAARRLIPLLGAALLAATAAPALTPAPARAACPDGSIRCVNKTIDRFYQVLDPLAQACDHDAIFALAYTRTTEAYKVANKTPGFFDDPRWVNLEDWWFGGLYFDAYDDWNARRTGSVPQAWRIAFNAADKRLDSGAGDLLLGINAHVQQDLPFALAKVGIIDADGNYRKHDHDVINTMLLGVLPRIVDEAARRFDNTIPAQLVNLSPITQLTFLQLVVAWREAAWQHAVQLVQAPSKQARSQVADRIEAEAGLEAQLIQTTLGYPPLLHGADVRKAYCLAHHND